MNQLSGRGKILLWAAIIQIGCSVLLTSVRATGLESLDPDIQNALLTAGHIKSVSIEKQLKESEINYSIPNRDGKQPSASEIQAEPDLRPTELKFSRNPAKFDEPVTITVMLEEFGGAAATNAELQYFLSADKSITLEDFYLGSDLFDIAAYGKETEEITFIPSDISGLTPGYWYAGFHIVGQNGSWVSSGPLVISLTGNVSDLDLTGFFWDTNPVQMDDPASFTMLFEEIGGEQVIDREIQYYLLTDMDTVTAGQFYIGSDFVTVEANSLSIQIFTFTPQEIPGLVPGSYFLDIRIPFEDDGWWVIEPLIITPASIDPDLEISAITHSKNPVYMNQTDTITATIQEIGGASVTDREIGYYLSNYRYPTTGDYFIGHDYVTLSADSQCTETIAFKPQNISNLNPGIYYVIVRIPDEDDYYCGTENLIIESVPKEPDLEIATIVLSDTLIQMDEPQTLTATIQELGGESVTNREIEYYLSDNDTINAGDYYIGSDFVTLSGNGQCTETITFTPQDISGLTPGTWYVGIMIPDEEDFCCSATTMTICEISAVDDPENTLPEVFTIFQNYPNPFNPVTAISYYLPEPSQVELSIYNVNGKCVERIVDEYQENGYHSVSWDATGYGSGIYFYRMKAGGFLQIKKCQLTK